MPTPLAPQVVLSKEQHQILQEISRKTTIGYRTVVRSKMILLMNEGLTNTAIAEQLNVSYPTVQVWRYKWLSYELILEKAQNYSQEEQNDKELKEKILEILRDRDRSGCPPTFTPEQYCQILSVALEPPEQSGLPITQWTTQELATECIKRNIVNSISSSQIGRFLKRSPNSASS